MAAATGKEAAKKPPLAVLTLDDILAADDLEECEVEVAEWGGKVVLRQLTRQQQVDCEKRATVNGEIDAPLLQLYQLSAALAKPEISFDKITALATKNSAVVGLLVSRVILLQGGGKEGLLAFEKSLLA